MAGHRACADYGCGSGGPAERGRTDRAVRSGTRRGDTEAAARRSESGGAPGGTHLVHRVGSHRPDDTARIPSSRRRVRATARRRQNSAADALTTIAARTSRHLTTGTSPTDPLPQALTKPAVNPLVDVSQNHSPVGGRHTAMSALPSPSTSPSSGWSPCPPHRLVSPANQLAVDLSQNQSPVDGRNTVMSSRPSPSKSASSGTSPDPPHRLVS